MLMFSGVQSDLTIWEQDRGTEDARRSSTRPNFLSTYLNQDYLLHPQSTRKTHLLPLAGQWLLLTKTLEDDLSLQEWGWIVEGKDDGAQG